jgi:DNA-binding response OmpR family regulator
MSKIFSIEELIARIRAVLRRKPNVENSQILRYKNISFNTESKKVMT